MLWGHDDRDNPPYPCRGQAAHRIGDERRRVAHAHHHPEDAVVLFKKESKEGLHPCDIKLVDGDWRLAGNSGYALVVTGSGSTMDEARREAYNRVKSVLIPNMFYRTDIGERWQRDGDLLQTWGYLS